MSQLSVNQLGAIDTTGLLDFFKAVAAGLGGSPAVVNVCDTIAHTLMQEHALINVGDFKARIPARPVMAEILIRAGAPLSYIDAIQQWLGVKFNLLPTVTNNQNQAAAGASACPTSIEAQAAQSGSSGYRSARFMTKNSQTLGEMLYAANRLDELKLPLGIYAGLPEPGAAVLPYKYISILSERIVVLMVLRYGMCDIDKIFRTAVGMQLEARYSNLAGNGGRPRKWGEVLKNRFLNSRKSASKVRAKHASHVCAQLCAH